ncbi:uncharacterized protein LOC143615794 [Bidens hawaiensis]|uniref:uncharacterized protein LOC143615794 n=1 Tax=Bidens hawaiensis TaxID=980011 RepID=UPI00404B5BB6
MDLNSDGVMLNKLFRTDVKNGESTWFWLDIRVDDCPLCNWFPNLFSIEKLKWCVVANRLYMIDGVICGRWDLQRDPTSLAYLKEFRGLLSICKHVIIRPVKDKGIWCGDHSGEFSVRSLKGLLLEMSLSRPNNVFVWNNWLPKKVGFVAWRAVFIRLPTMEALAKRNILVSSLDCPICGKGMETVDHVFISCDFSQAVWCLISQWCKVPSIYAFSVRDLVELHRYASFPTDKAKAFHAVCLVTIWCIWKKRNDVVKKGGQVHPRSLIEEVKPLGFLWIRNRSKRRGLPWEDWSRFRL